MVIEITLLIAAGLGNFAWDITGRRVNARMRRRARQARRASALGLVPIDPREQDDHDAPGDLIEQTRRCAEELDRVVDHFDLVLLRAEAAESLVGDVVFVGAQLPRARGKDCLDAWLAAVDALPPSVRERLREFGLPDEPLATILQRERERGLWPHAETATDVLEATAGDFEQAFALLSTFLRSASAQPRDPYR